MSNHLHSPSRTWGAVGAIALAALISSAAESTAFAQGTGQKGIVGVWLVQVTLRDCTSNAPLGPSVDSIVTFHLGGTITESAAPAAFAPGQRTHAQGTWERSTGASYIQKMVALIAFDTPPNPPSSPGFFAGWQTVTHRIVQTDEDTLTSSGTNAFFRTDGQLYRTGCSTAVAKRFE